MAAESLAEENVLAATFDIAKAFDDLQLAHKKEVYCTIVTAQVGVEHDCCWGGPGLASRLAPRQAQLELWGVLVSGRRGTSRCCARVCHTISSEKLLFMAG